MYIVKMDSLKTLNVTDEGGIVVQFWEHPDDKILTKSCVIKLKPNMLVHVENRDGAIFATPMKSSLTHYSENLIRKTWNESWQGGWDWAFHSLAESPILTH